MAKMVKDCVSQWKLMDGSSNEEKRINAYLCSVWITRFDIPSDECISYAQKISKLSNPKKQASKVKKILEPLFTYEDSNGNECMHPKEEIVNKLINDFITFLQLIKE